MSHINKLLEIIKYLREDPEGCAWTKEQTHQSLTPYLIEEAYETTDVIDQGKSDEDLKDELGDVLLQLALHSQIADERNSFNFDDIAKSITEKLIRRYPSILGDEPNNLKTPEEIDRRWEEIKTEERLKKGIDPKKTSILDDVSHGLPALLRAAKLKGRMAKEGWEWPDISMLLDKVSEELNELREEIEVKKINKTRIAAELGDVMFLIVDFARWYNIDAEDALRITNNRVERRFRHMEQKIKDLGKNIKTSTRDERIEFWNEAKELEKKNLL